MAKKRFLFRTAISILSLGLVLGCIASFSSTPAITSGPAPDFTLTGVDGNQVTLSDLEGQVVVLDFWATWCSPCVEGLPELQALHERYADRGVVVLAINIEEKPEEVRDFLAGRSYTFPVLLDADAQVTNQYGVQAIPHHVVIRQDGEIYAVPLGNAEIPALLEELLSP